MVQEGISDVQMNGLEIWKGNHGELARGIAKSNAWRKNFKKKNQYPTPLRFDQKENTTKVGKQ